MAVLCEDLNLLFICVPKTGSTAISHMLIRDFGGRWLPSENTWDSSHSKIIANNKHSTVFHLVENGHITAEQMASYRIVAFTRNPFDWLVSSFFFHREIRQTLRRQFPIFEPLMHHFPFLVPKAMRSKLPDWVVDKGRIYSILTFQNFSFEDHVIQTCHTYDQSIYESFTSGADVEILRYENLPAEMSRVFKEQGVKQPPPVPSKNVSSSRRQDFRTYYTPFTRRLVEKAFANDLERFNYSFHENRSIHRSVSTSPRRTQEVYREDS